MHCFPGPLARIAGYRVHDAEQADPGDKEEKHEEKCHLRCYDFKPMTKESKGRIDRHMIFIDFIDICVSLTFGEETGVGEQNIPVGAWRSALRPRS